ncbi:AAA family ATPase [Alkalibacterium indicireducens]|uniref:AAA+ ATPase domain-containing protein n=1 Tax=Alkalibacterium indicireducens TaxID=398758 RepID=A0ABP3L7E5_9LACT
MSEEKVDTVIKEVNKLMLENNSLRAISILKKEIRKYPEEAKFHYYLARAYFENQRLERAIRFAKKAEELGENTPDFYVLLVELYIETDNITKAETAVEKAAELDKESTKTQLSQAKLAFHKRKHDDASKLISSILEKEKNVEALQLNVKILLHNASELDDILRAIEEVAEIEYTEVLEYYKAQAYFLHKEYDKLKYVYQQINRNNPNSSFLIEIKELIEQIRVREKEDANPFKKTNGNREEKTIEEALAELDALIGLDSVKEEVKKIVKSVEYNQHRQKLLGIEESERPAYHFAFLGNPGTGKTTVARILGDIFHSLGIIEKNEVVEVDRSKLVAVHVGATAQKTSEAIEAAMGGVLFVDEAYALAPRSENSNDFGPEAIDTLIKAMEDNRDNLIVILSGYNDEMRRLMKVNPGLSSRVNLQIQFEDYSEDQLLDIAHSFAKKEHYTLTEDGEKAFLQRISEKLVDEHFANAREVRNIIEAAIREKAFRFGENSLTKENLTQLTPVDFGVDLEQLYGEDLDDLLEELNGLEGLDNVKEQITSLMNYIQVEKRKDELGLPTKPMTLHMAFLGNPGTGKTTVARLVGKILKSIGILKKGQLVEVSRQDLVAGYTGQTAPKTLNKVKEAYGGVLFIDEAYSLASSGSSSDFGSEAVSTLITEMENNRERLVVIVAGYTKEMQDFFSINSGVSSRINYHIEFPDYNPDQLVNIFKLHAKNDGYSLDEKALTALHKRFVKEYAHRSNDFGNGRLARSYFEKAKMKVANRTVKDLEADITRITVEDI